MNDKEEDKGKEQDKVQDKVVDKDMDKVVVLDNHSYMFGKDNNYYFYLTKKVQLK